MREQAVSYGERFKRRGEDAIMNVYEFDELPPGFSYKLFEAYDGEWLDLVTDCRKCIEHKTYDVIEGGIADDHVFDTIDLYFLGIYTREQALDKLVEKKPNHQIFITSQDVLTNTCVLLNQSNYSMTVNPTILQMKYARIVKIFAYIFTNENLKYIFFSPSFRIFAVDFSRKIKISTADAKRKCFFEKRSLPNEFKINNVKN